MINQGFERTAVNRIRLHVLPTDRFKTYAISANIGVPLAEDDVTPVALLPFVLRRGTAKYPETKKFREKLDDLFGAGFGFDIYKRGDNQIVQFRMDVINDQFVEGRHDLLKQSLQFLGETLFAPALENGTLRGKYVESEKVTLQKRLEAIVNDKIKYAAERCIQEMCKDEPYRLNPLGKVTDLPSITPESLYTMYQRWLQNAVIDLYVAGNTTPDEVKSLVEAYFPMQSGQTASYDMRTAFPEVQHVKRVEEQLDVTQGKLNMGLRSYVTYGDEAYPAALMYNGILGGYPHSKLFTNVREKASLAYYAASRLDGHKGIITIQSGIEFENYEKAVDIIERQLELMRQGDISDLEWMQTRAMIGNSLREMQDSAHEMISFDFNNMLTGKERTIPQLIAEIDQVDKQAVQRMAEQVKLDTIYFLRNKKGE
ncbi:EF-P 5-aminopentanol modification-associated protein YfmF [Ferviditalea candida]|uniref:Pitrilysin family protein n=1 Tax=Ferviditalea candida TaxID=3108399 RepID=A0ABU5ZLT8_9BACL|nr:pitrilysin family protein [Paenibacillaceae bacterium T2]